MEGKKKEKERCHKRRDCLVLKLLYLSCCVVWEKVVRKRKSCGFRKDGCKHKPRILAAEPDLAGRFWKAKELCG